MRVRVDLDRCSGHSQCELAAPEVFHVTDDGQAQLLQESPPEALREAVRNAVKRCPERAISADG